MANDDEVNKALKNLVKEIVSKLFYKLAKASAQNAAAGLKKKLKEEAIRKIEDKLKETTEEQLAKTCRKLGKEIAKDNPNGADYTSRLRQVFEEKCDKFLSSLKGLSTLAVTVITSVCALVAGLAIGGGVAYQYIEPTPTPTLPQPDLVITEITFDIETTPEGEVAAADEDSLFYQFTIHYTVKNQGDAEAGASTICLQLNGEDVAQDIASPLAPEGTYPGAFDDYHFSEEAFSANLCTFGIIRIELRADSTGCVCESDEGNNCFGLEFTIHD